MVGARGELAVEAEEALLFGGERLCVSWSATTRALGQRGYGLFDGPTLTSTLFFWCGFMVEAAGGGGTVSAVDAIDGGVCVRGRYLAFVGGA